MAREMVVAGLGTALGYTVLYGGPVYRAAVAAETGWSAEATAGAFALGFAVAIPTPLLAGLAADRWGVRAPLAAGAALIALAAGGAACAGALWHWYASVGIGLVVGAKTLWAAATILAARSARPGRAVGTLQAVIGGALALGPLITQALIEAAGWRAVLALNAVVLMGLAVWAAWPRVRPEPPPRPEPGADRRREGGSPDIPPALIAAFFAGNFLIGIFDESVYQHGYAFGLALGLPGVAAAGVISVVSLAYLAGGMGAGVLCDAFGQRRLLVAGALLAALALSGFALESRSWLWLSAPLFGIALGTSITARSVAWAAAFGGPRLGRYVGMVTPGYDAGAALVTWGGAAWLDASGGDFRALYLVAAAAALGWAAIGAVATRARRSRYASAPGARNAAREMA